MFVVVLDIVKSAGSESEALRRVLDQVGRDTVMRQADRVLLLLKEREADHAWTCPARPTSLGITLVLTENEPPKWYTNPIAKVEFLPSDVRARLAMILAAYNRRQEHMGTGLRVEIPKACRYLIEGSEVQA